MKEVSSLNGFEAYIQETETNFTQFAGKRKRMKPKNSIGKLEVMLKLELINGALHDPYGKRKFHGLILYKMSLI